MRFGLPFSQRMATKPLSLATSFNSPTGDEITLYALFIDISVLLLYFKIDPLFQRSS